MRTPGADQRLEIANVERGAWKALGHGEQEAALQGEGRRRTRRGMTLGQKKQPQRGLGVAQLEKLRMQEQQSKSMGQTQVGAMYLHHIKAGAISHQHSNWPLGLRNGRPPDKVAAKEGHMQVGTRDDVLWTFMSPAHSRSVSLSRHEHGHTVMSIMVPLGRDKRDSSGVCNHDHHHPHIPVPLAKNVHDRPPSSAADNPSSPGTSVDRLPPLLAGNGDKSKELSSVQNIVSSNHLRSSESCGWKRPWQALHESHPNRCLDLNAGAMNSGHIALGHQTSAPHQSDGFIRAAVPEDCSTHPLKISLCGTRPSEFLTLGLPSYNPISAQHEDRVQSQEANRSHVDICSKGGDDNLQLHLCNPQQAQVQRMQSYPDLTDEPRPTYRCSSGSLTEECHKGMERKTEESLDLRLKLAI